MREKLANAQRLLGDVITADYEAIYRDAAPLWRISETEVASWQARSNPDYTKNAVLFLRSVESLRTASTDRDIDATRQEYINLITSCIRCHTQVRDTRSVSLPQFPSVLPEP